MFAAASVVAISFLGFDAVTTLSEEALDPQRDVPRAVVITCLVAGGLFIVVCAVAYRAHPVADVRGRGCGRLHHGRRYRRLRGWRPSIAIAELIGSFAGALAGQAGAARLIFGISRATGLGRGVLDRVHATRQVPTGAVGVLAATGLLAFVLTLEQVVSLINFGALTGFLVVHAAAAREGLARHPARTPASLGAVRAGARRRGGLRGDAAVESVAHGAARRRRMAGGRSRRAKVSPTLMALLTCASHAVSGDHLIANQRVTSARTLAVTSPIDGTPLGEIAAGDAAAADEAVEAARQAFPAWAALGPGGRGPVLRRLADLIERDMEALALVETTNNGSLLEASRLRVMKRAAHNIRFFADLAETLAAPAWDTDGANAHNRVRYDPAGPTALITPWNAPLDAGHVEGRAGAGRRQHRGVEAGGVDAASRRRCSPTWPWKPGCRRACSTCCRGVGPEAGAALVRPPGHSPDLVHGLAAHGAAHRRGGRGATSRRSASSWAASRRSSCATTPIWTWQPRPRPASTTTPGRCAWRAPGCWYTRRSTTNSPPACGPESPRFARAIRAIPLPR